jgi:hypothetical protein
LSFRHSGPPKNPALPDSVASAEIPGPRRLIAKFNRLQKPATSWVDEASFSWHETLGLRASADAVEVRRARSPLALTYHPDKGGTQQPMTRIHQAYAQGRVNLGSHPPPREAPLRP